MEQKNNQIIQVLSFLGGILATIFFLGFLFLTSFLRSDSSFFIVGSLLIVAALILNYRLDKPFLNAINITCYIAGFSLITYALFRDQHMMFIVQIAFCIITIIMSRGFVLTFLAIIAGYLSLCAEITHLFHLFNSINISIPLIMLVYLLMNMYETKTFDLLKQNQVKYNAIHTGVFVSCLLSLATLSMSYLVVSSDGWQISILMWIGVLFMAYKIMKVMSITHLIHQAGIYLLCLIICIPTLYFPYLSGSILLILICFYYGYRAECGVALALLVYAISKFYYDLSITLLIKSISLFCIGIALLIAWYFITHKKTTHEEI